MPGALWVDIQDDTNVRKRLQVCPSGHILIRASDPVFDQCIPCRYGKYSVSLAIYPSQLHTANASAAMELCEDCPDNAECIGGNIVVPDRGYWIHENDRALVNASAIPSPDGPKSVKVYQCQVATLAVTGPETRSSSLSVAMSQ